MDYVEEFGEDAVSVDTYCPMNYVKDWVIVSLGILSMKFADGQLRDW